MIKLLCFSEEIIFDNVILHYVLKFLDICALQLMLWLADEHTKAAWG
jgi:hypothetical protein